MARKDDLRDALDKRDRPEPNEPDEDVDDPDDDDEPDEDVDDPDDDDEPDDKDKRKAPTVAQLQAELKRTQDNLRRARREVRRARNGTRPASRTDRDRDEPDDDRDDRRDDRRDRRSRDRDANREADRRARSAEERALRSDAKVALIRAGADPDLVELAASKVSSRDIDFDDDDAPILDDWVEDMRTDYPSLFTGRRRGDEDEEDRPARRRRVPAVDQGAASRGSGGRSRSRDKMGFGQSVIAAGRAADGANDRRRRR